MFRKLAMKKLKTVKDIKFKIKAHRLFMNALVDIGYQLAIYELNGVKSLAILTNDSSLGVVCTIAEHFHNQYTPSEIEFNLFEILHCIRSVDDFMIGFPLVKVKS